MVQSLYISGQSVQFRRQKEAPFRLWLGGFSFIYTFFRLYRWTGWDKCWTFLVLLAVSVSFWQMTPPPPAWNETGGAQEYVLATLMTWATQLRLFRQTLLCSCFLVPPLMLFAVLRPQAVTWAWSWAGSWGQGWRVLCRAEGRGHWLSPGGAAGRPGAPRYGACTGQTMLGFGWWAVRQDGDTVKDKWNSDW